MLIVWVDDQPGFLIGEEETIKENFRGTEIVSKTNARRALTHITKYIEDIDIIILDIIMPYIKKDDLLNQEDTDNAMITGLVLFREIVNLIGDTSVVFYTINNAPEIVTEIEEAGAVFVYKPEGSAKLIVALEGLGVL